MIHGAIFPVTCDNKDCRMMIQILASCYTIKKRLKECKWILINSKHYCCEECAREAEDGK